MAEEEEILELNDDGEFVVPTKPIVLETSQQSFQRSVDSVPAPAAPTSISSGASKVSDVLSSIAPGEYKVFAYDNKVDVIVHLEDPKHTVSRVNINTGSILCIETSVGTRLNIDTSTLALQSPHEQLTAANATACNYQDYVVVTFM